MNEREILERLLEQAPRRYYGKYQGFVVDNQDPKKRGRIRALVPEVLGPDVVSGWAEPCFPCGGIQDFGNFWVPPVTKKGKDEYTTGVWIEFQGGDPQYPIWVGTFFGAPGNVPEAPGDDAPPDVDVRVDRSFSGHSIVAVDTDEKQRLEIRDATGQKLTFSGPLKPGVKRDEEGKKATETTNVEYGDLVANQASVTLRDFAGNTLLLDATKAAPTIRITNQDSDGKILQTIELTGSSENPQVVITDNNKNTITMSKEGIEIKDQQHGDTITLDASGISQKAERIRLNGGTMGAARRNDRTQSTAMDDPAFWMWVETLMMWLETHIHTAPPVGGPTTPPVAPFPGSTPSKCTGRIIQSSESVIIGD